MLDAFHMTAVLEAAVPAPVGQAWVAVCVHCLHASDPHEQYIARRSNTVGWCQRCTYTGHDMFVARLPVPM